MDEDIDWDSFMEEHYDPDWLRKGLIDGAFSWESGYTGTLTHFLDRYTLHDSYWVGLWLQTTGSGIAVIRWDLAWNQPIDDKEERDDVPFWPILVVRFERLHVVRVVDGPRKETRGGESITWAESRPIGEAGISGRHETILHGGVEIRLVHDPVVSILLINRSGEAIPIPDI
ncbi:MAG TPA: hypothetical protein VFB58_05920 [Chloroflexota bacterium]|nr:hypothetical protein [Chloroflexota bacterium]